MKDLAYQEMIYNKLLALDAKMARIFPYTDVSPELMKGGTRARIHPLPGVTMETYGPGTLAVGGQIRDARYREPPLRKNTVITQLHGGAKKTSPWIQFVKEFSAKHGIPYREALKKAGESYKKLEGGKVNRLKKARKWRDFAKDTVETGFDLFDKGATLVKKHGSGLEMEGAGKKSGKISRRKKARKWSDFAKDTVETGFDLFDKGATLVKKHGGKVNRLKKATKWRDFAKDTVETGMNLADKGATLVRKHGGSRAPSQWIQFVKEFSAKHKVPYNQALKLAGTEYRKIKG